ncbi:MAG: hypothetical protein OIF50_04220, partial [Flavobacteriaceae bacterium]|nr:hypothetical protein [Flavobacteriaceae bacterium]
MFLESLDENWQPVGELVTPEGYRFAMHDDRSISERVLSIVKDSQGKYRAGVKILGKGDLKSLSQWMDELSDQKLLQRLNNLSDAQKIKLNTYLSKAKTDLDANAFKQFKKALQQKNGIEAWKLIDKAIGNKTITKFAYDAKTLTKVAQMSDAKSNFRKALGVDWEKELQAILKNNSDLKCNACGNKGRSYRSSMDEFLEEIDYFVANFDIRHSNKGKKLFQWAKGRGVDGKLIKNFQDLPIADELSQHL